MKMNSSTSLTLSALCISQCRLFLCSALCWTSYVIAQPTNVFQFACIPFLSDTDGFKPRKTNQKNPQLKSVVNRV